MFCPFDENKKPPNLLELGIAEHSFVITLADDKMMNDEDL
jgi:hypothetical protein